MPRSVNQAAFRVLDALFPMGKLSRRAVSLLFRLWLHPGAGFIAHCCRAVCDHPNSIFGCTCTCVCVVFNAMMASCQSRELMLCIHMSISYCAARKQDSESDDLAKSTNLIIATLLRSFRLPETCLILSRRVAASCVDSSEDCGTGVHGVAAPAVAKALGGQANSAAPAHHLSSAANQWRRRNRAAAAEEALIRELVEVVSPGVSSVSNV